MRAVEPCKEREVIQRIYAEQDQEYQREDSCDQVQESCALKSKDNIEVQLRNVNS